MSIIKHITLLISIKHKNEEKLRKVKGCTCKITSIWASNSLTVRKIVYVLVTML